MCGKEIKFSSIDGWIIAGRGGLTRRKIAQLVRYQSSSDTFVGRQQQEYDSRATTPSIVDMYTKTQGLAHLPEVSLLFGLRSCIIGSVISGSSLMVVVRNRAACTQELRASCHFAMIIKEATRNHQQLSSCPALLLCLPDASDDRAL
jgi:hypothetical protein